MSLFDLQDVCIAIGSIATLDLPMVADLIGIYGLKGPYCTLTTTNWFLQALSVIPMGSWGDVSRRSYHDPMGKSGIPPPPPSSPPFSSEIRSGQFDEENPSVQISSCLLVQGVSGRGPDWRYLPQSTKKSRRYCNYGWSQAQVPASHDMHEESKNNRKSRPTTQLENQRSLNTTHSQLAGGNHRSVIFRSDTQSTITAQWSSRATTQPTTTSMIALDLSGTTTQPADHNASSTQASIKFRLNISVRANSDLTLPRYPRTQSTNDKSSLAHPDFVKSEIIKPNRFTPTHELSLPSLV
ncbi:protein EMBRYONIC FLOWER 1 [Dorcoceras hygrometricum]|uniref:Protein EMBRYONIC FLOWER 1 n=1 Tax=Dorcoceras hygrometricum TaxID=472368 RepID=A0A2Z7A7P4_9LAMI|nr:protein EMBRYONIC FLOWER 1 [Dorcoceras hygrometricum]